MPNSAAKLLADQFYTGHHSFHDCPGARLFTVRAGVPIDQALEHASNLLDSAYYVAQQAADGNPSLMVHALWTTMHLVEAANAVIEATLQGVGANDD